MNVDPDAIRDRSALNALQLERLREMLAHILPALARTEYPRVVERYRHHFTERDAHTTLFSGACLL